MNIAILGNWHALSNAHQYATAFRQLGHRVTTAGPRFTGADADRWYKGLLAMEWPPSTVEAQEYVHSVLAQSPVPDMETLPGAWFRPGKSEELVLKFDAYGESPLLDGDARDGYRAAIVFGDTHTGQLKEQVETARCYDHTFVQFRLTDMDAFREGGVEHVHWLPAAADPELWRYERVEKRYEVLFVGSTSLAHVERNALLRFLKAQLGEHRVVVKHAFGKDMSLEMNRAHVVLNRSLNGDLNMRVPEALCLGAQLLTDQVPGLFTLSEHMWRYSSREECLRLCQLFRQGEGGPERSAMLDIRERHTYEHRAQTILKSVFGGNHEPSPTSRPLVAAAPPDRSDPSPDAGTGTRTQVEVPTLDRDRTAAPSAGPRVSLIIPVYNHWEDCTRPLLDRLLPVPQLPDDSVEILVVDDGSTDETKDRPGYDYCGGAATILHKEHGGFASACNFGAHHARGQYLVFLNNDTEPAPGWLPPLLEQLERGAGVVGPWLKSPGGMTQSFGLSQNADGEWVNVGELGAYPKDVPSQQEAITGACLSISRDLFWRLGGFDAGFQNGCEDVDLCLHARAAGQRVVLVPQSVVVHQEGSTRFHASYEHRLVVEYDHNTERLKERWHNESRESLSGGDGSRSSDSPAGSSVGRLACPAVTRIIVWEGPIDVRAGGSLAVINKALQEQLRSSYRLHYGRDCAPVQSDLWVTHLFPGTEAHQPPPEGAKHWVVIQPWELGPPPSTWQRTWEHTAFRQLWTPSEYSRQLFLGSGLERSQVRVLPNGVDTQVFRPEGLRWETRGEHLRFLYVGGLIWRKGVDLLQAAWERAFRPDDQVRLYLKSVGRGTYYGAGNIDAWVAGQPLVRTVHDSDNLTAEELAALYRSVDVLVAPSRAEAFCLPVLEAMACGIPVIVPSLGPTNEYCDDSCSLQPLTRWQTGSQGMYYEIPVEELAKVLRWCSQHPAALKDLGEGARRRAQDYSWEKIAERYRSALEELLK